MAKKKTENDPVIDALFDAMSCQFNAIVCHALQSIGPELALTVMERIKCEVENQMKELQEVSLEYQRKGS